MSLCQRLEDETTSLLLSPFAENRDLRGPISWPESVQYKIEFSRDWPDKTDTRSMLKLEIHEIHSYGSQFRMINLQSQICNASCGVLVS